MNGQRPAQVEGRCHRAKIKSKAELGTARQVYLPLPFPSLVQGHQNFTPPLAKQALTYPLSLSPPSLPSLLLPWRQLLCHPPHLRIRSMSPLQLPSQALKYRARLSCQGNTQHRWGSREPLRDQQPFCSNVKPELTNSQEERQNENIN